MVGLIWERQLNCRNVIKSVIHGYNCWNYTKCLIWMQNVQTPILNPQVINLFLRLTWLDDYSITDCPQKHPHPIHAILYYPTKHNIMSAFKMQLISKNFTYNEFFPVKRIFQKYTPKIFLQNIPSFRIPGNHLYKLNKRGREKY